ncbi:MAG: hypothetical protein ABIK09_00125 [Pseudomonadota bacterium]
MLRFVLALLVFCFSFDLHAEPASFCLSNTACSAGHHCLWGVCNSDMAPDPGPLFAVGVGRILDLTPRGEAETVIARFREVLVRQLNATGFFSARVYRRESQILDTPGELARRGVAYWIQGRVVEINEVAVTIQIEVINTMASRPILALGLQLSDRRDDLDDVVTHWVNRMVEHFTGRPGLLGTRFTCVRKNGWGKKEVMTFDFGEEAGLQITHDGSLAVLPAWTPDGRVAFTSFKSGQALVYIQGVAAPFADFPPMATGIHWSPDGSLAVLTLNIDENPEIYVIEGASGAMIARLTTHTAIDTTPRFAPDGASIAFVSDRSGSPQLYLMDPNGLNKRRLTVEGAYNTSPAWHPNGRYIAYTARRGGFQIDVIDLETHQVRQLTHGPGDNEEPSFSQDGRYILYTRALHKRKDLYIMNADGSGKRRINADDGVYSNPVWEWPPR